MRHNRRTKKFQRSWSERRSMFENLVTSLLVHQQIKTTLQKAKEAKRLADHVITLGKNDSIASRRKVFSYLQDHALTSKIFKEVAPRFKNRNGGYTRILQLSRRKGDGASLALLELTEKEILVKDTTKAKAKKEAKHGHAGHEHGAEAKEAPKKGEAKDAHAKHPEPRQEKPKPKGGFFKNLSKFFRNKGGG